MTLAVLLGGTLSQKVASLSARAGSGGGALGNQT